MNNRKTNYSQKGAIDLNRHFTNEDAQMTNMKTCPESCH